MGTIIGFLVGFAGLAFIAFVLISTGTHFNGNAKLMGLASKKTTPKTTSFSGCKNLRGIHSQFYLLKAGETYDVEVEVEEEKGEALVTLRDKTKKVYLNDTKTQSFSLTPENNLKLRLDIKFNSFNGSVKVAAKKRAS